MSFGQNDDIEPATATGPVAAASRARRAARTALRLASAARVADPAGGPAGRVGIRDNHLGAGPDVLLVDALHHIGLLQVGPGAPRHMVHRHALSLQLAAHAAVDDHPLTV